jgi:hypothetical protein
MASKDPNVSKQSTAGRRRHLTLTLQLEIIKGLVNDDSQRGVVTSHNIGL